jgi:transposase
MSADTYPSAATACCVPDLFEAANVILARYSRASALRAWGLALDKHIGKRRAKVAVARKLAVIMHRMRVDGTDFMEGGKVAA